MPRRIEIFARSLLALGISGLLAWNTACAEAVSTVDTAVPGALAGGGSMVGPAVRTVVSLAAVLAILGACAWFIQRIRNGAHLKGGLIEIVSGVSLGNREKVVLLRVGTEQIVVGISPAGMRSLHVISTQPAPGNEQARSFDEYLEPVE